LDIDGEPNAFSRVSGPFRRQFFCTALYLMNGPRCRLAATGAAVATTFIVAVAVLSAGPLGRQGGAAPPQQRPVFGTGVDLVVVNATVTDHDGYFVRGLRERDFEVREDGRPQPIAAFSSERVPVSIGIALDLSNSMKGEKLRAAKSALFRLLDELLDPEDEIFLYSFSDEPLLLQSWTTRRDLLRKALDGASAGGLTALYDTTAQAVSMAATGRHRKKALVIISDGTDTASHTDVHALQRQIRESDVLVYAIGIEQGAADRQAERPRMPVASDPWASPPDPRLPPFPPRPPTRPGQPRSPLGPGGAPPAPPRAPIPKAGQQPGGEADAYALRELTGDSGGRTEIIRSAADLPPVTAGIADELSRQYFLGYQGMAPRDGLWHTIEVSVRRPNVRVRARTGYFAAGDGRF
jgi:VWFA-related protein